MGIFLSTGDLTAALCTALVFFCFIRLEKPKRIPWLGIRVIHSIFVRASASLPRKAICTRIQYVAVESRVLIRVLLLVLHQLPDWMLDIHIWLLSHQELVARWDWALRILGMSSRGLLLSGLRGGGAIFSS